MATKLLTPNMGIVDRSFRAFVVAPAAIVAAILIGARRSRRSSCS